MLLSRKGPNYGICMVSCRFCAPDQGSGFLRGWQFFPRPASACPKRDHRTEIIIYICRSHHRPDRITPQFRNWSGQYNCKDFCKPSNQHEPYYMPPEDASIRKSNRFQKSNLSMFRRYKRPFHQNRHENNDDSCYRQKQQTDRIHRMRRRGGTGGTGKGRGIYPGTDGIKIFVLIKAGPP